MSTLGSARRKIVYLSGTRADFSLMQATLTRLTRQADVSVAVTGMHLDPRYGNTLQEIKASGLRICTEIATDVETRTPQSMAQGIGECLQGVTDLLVRERPNILLLLGDRGEMLAGAVAALHLGVVCVHIHGGERTGTVDEPVRHAISKLSHYHLVATNESRQRLIRMGERPDHVVVTGAPGLDGLTEQASLSREQCRSALGLEDATDYVLVLFHPVVQQFGDAYVQTLALLDALDRVAMPVVWIDPNSDAGSLGVLRALQERGLPNGSRRFAHLGPRALFASAMRHAAVMVGNSSAGIIEAASLGTPVINIGQRQRLRERNMNVVDIAPDAQAIHEALNAALEHGRWPCENRYGDGRAGERIAQWLLECAIDPAVLEKTNAY